MLYRKLLEFPLVISINNLLYITPKGAVPVSVLVSHSQFITHRNSILIDKLVNVAQYTVNYFLYTNLCTKAIKSAALPDPSQTTTGTGCK